MSLGSVFWFTGFATFRKKINPFVHLPTPFLSFLGSTECLPKRVKLVRKLNLWFFSEMYHLGCKVGLS